MFNKPDGARGEGQGQQQQRRARKGAHPDSRPGARKKDGWQWQTAGRQGVESGGSHLCHTKRERRPLNHFILAFEPTEQKQQQMFDQSRSCRGGGDG